MKDFYNKKKKIEGWTKHKEKKIKIERLLRSNPKKKKKSKVSRSTTWGTTGDDNNVAYLMLVSVFFFFNYSLVVNFLFLAKIFDIRWYVRY